MTTPDFIRPDGNDLIRDGADAITQNADAAHAARWNRGTITTGDLNNYTTPGTYRIPAITGIANLPPRPRAGSLEVIPQLAEATPVLQRYSYVNSFDNPQVFVRAGGGSNWGPWTNIGSSATLIDPGTDVDTLIYPMRWMTALAVTTNGLIGLPAECRSGPIILDVSRTVGSDVIARSLQEVTLLLTDAPPRRWMRSIDLVEGPTDWREVTHTGPNTPVLIGWGSSTIRLAQDALSDLATSMGGGQYVHGGRGGDLSAHIAARLGSTPALLTFPSNQIPASGSVTVTSSNMPARDTSSWEGTVSGVDGELTLSYTGFTFTRATPGAAVTSPPDSPFIPSLGVQHRNAETVILNIGKNDMVNEGGDTEAIAATAAAWDYLQPLRPERTLVVGHYVNTNTTAESPNRARINATNAAFASAYGSRYIDLGAAVTSPDVWDEVGLTPTSTDLAQQALGNLPPSLGMDTAHLNEHGNRVLARLVRDRLTATRSDQRTAAVVAAGRPDIPATLAPDVATRVQNAPSGTVFRSTDGPQGAWEWTKRGSSWACTSGDTGHRSCPLGPQADAGQITLQRVGDLVTVRLIGVTLTGGPSRILSGQSLTGFSPVDGHPTANVNSYAYGHVSVNGDILTWNRIMAYRFGIQTLDARIAGNVLDGQFTYHTDDAWPTALPGEAH